ncbi:DUF4136 domain-containing protein [Aestuariibacter sp. A3R04]|uniref:DUF4136 domain-containing protein n=1 Tax=Aestuariibacter sp. A3R04 TaxID=2841571 RepID=UPI001C09EA49|nr:DUF4136 domain-containing protein [Aestuariibacter sp. A3R04]MBU3022035.1 DUF4136 domain-containing protein [Aestuariibacter sp. A3R04]
MMQSAYTRKFLLLIALLIAIAGCASNKPEISISKEQNFAAIDTFYIQPPVNVSNKTIANHMMATINTILTHKGLRAASQGEADVTVVFYPSTAKKEEGKSISFGLGTGTFGRSGGISLGSVFSVPVGEQESQYQNLQIDVVKGGQFIYSAVGSTELDAKDSIAIQQNLTELVTALLAPYPAKNMQTVK